MDTIEKFTQFMDDELARMLERLESMRDCYKDFIDDIETEIEEVKDERDKVQCILDEVAEEISNNYYTELLSDKQLIELIIRVLQERT